MKTALRALLVLLPTLLVSCEAIRSGSTRLRIRKLGDKWEVTSNAGRCAKITFYGYDGELGCEVFRLPAEAICGPPGTRGVHGEIVDCPTDLRGHLHSTRGTLPSPSGGSSQESLGSPAGPVVEGLETYRFFGLPGQIEPGEVYLEYDLEIRAPTRPQARALRDRILGQAHQGLSGFRRHVPGVYAIHHLARAQFVGRDLCLTLFSTQRYEDLVLDLNGQRQYRNLEDALLVDRNGMFMAELTIGLSDLRWGLLPGFEYVNSYRIELKAGGKSELIEGEWGYRI